MTVVYVIIGIFIVLIAIAGLSAWSDKNYVGPWNVYAVCKCGWYARAPFGKLFHVHEEVCPDCGAPKDEGMTLMTRRWNKGKWEVKA